MHSGLVAHLVGAIAALLITAALPAMAAATALPTDANVINVKASPYNAKGDGTTDDTAAIQAAISDFDNAAVNSRYTHPRLIYFPPGTYKVSNTIDNRSTYPDWYNCSVQLFGAGQNDVIIKLKDNCSGFTSAASPKSIFIWIGEHYAGNEAFRNAANNLTIDVGIGNAGAIGLEYSS